MYGKYEAPHALISPVFFSFLGPKFRLSTLFWYILIYVLMLETKFHTKQ
jgi:hypothetical protein